MTTLLAILAALLIGAVIGAAGMALLAAGRHDELQREIEALREPPAQPFQRKPLRDGRMEWHGGECPVAPRRPAPDLAPLRKPPGVTDEMVQAIASEIRNRPGQWLEQSIAYGLAWGVWEQRLSRETQADALQAIANRVCQHCPPGFVVYLCMEDGAAWVQLGEDRKGLVALPDNPDGSLLDQLNDALCTANGFMPPNSQAQRLAEGQSGEADCSASADTKEN